MGSIKPYKTTLSLMQSIQDRIMFPFSQATLSFNSVLSMVNEELIDNAVPGLREMHNEYFVYTKNVPLIPNVGIYPIPDRAQAMVLRDLNYVDVGGRFHEMARTSPEDKAFFQGSSGNNESFSKFYVQGNNIILNPIVTAVTGSLNMSFFMRPNFLVRDDRACIIQNFQKPITVGTVSVGDILNIVLASQTEAPLTVMLTAVSGTAALNQFTVGATPALTAISLVSAITALNIDNFIASSTQSVVMVTYETISTSITSLSSALVVDNTYTYVIFDQLPSTYVDIDTNEMSPFYTINSKVDFLQTNPGHEMYAYDVKLKGILSGNVGKFLSTDLMTYRTSSAGTTQKAFWPILTGDYICLNNECIIPQIPPEHHSMLAEMTASRILSAIGDKDGYAISQARIGQMGKQSSALVGNRIEGQTIKVFNSNSLLRSSGRRRF